MVFTTEKRDLFSVDFNYWTPAHCVSSDCKMGAGIAVPMRKMFGLGEMKNLHPNALKHPTCVYYNGVLNLITKEKYWYKPTPYTMENALVSMRTITKSNGIKKVVMPKIGSGLDKLRWSVVEDIIKAVFNEEDIEIWVCFK